MPDEKQHHDKWERKPAIDLWSIPHFLFGLLMGTTPVFFGLTTSGAVAAAGVLAVGWEIGEYFYGIEESPANVVMDIVLAILGCGFVVLGLSAYPLERDTLLVATGAVFLVYAYTNISGWLAYRRRNKDFRR